MECKTTSFLLLLYRRLHPHEYFTPLAVMEAIENDTTEKGDEDMQLRVVIGNPPYTTERNR